MPHPLRWAAVPLALLALWAVPAVSAAAKPLTLTATATVPGVAAPQSVTVRLATETAGRFRVVARPDASTVELVDRPTKVVRREGKRVRVEVQPCARGTLHVALVPGSGDALGVARFLVPQAQQEGVLESRSPTWSHSRRESVLAYRLVFDASPDHFDRMTKATSFAAWSWATAPAKAVVAVRMDAVRLRSAPACRPSGAAIKGRPDAQDIWAMSDRMATMWLLALELANPIDEGDA